MKNPIRTLIAVTLGAIFAIAATFAADSVLIPGDSKDSETGRRPNLKLHDNNDGTKSVVVLAVIVTPTPTATSTNTPTPTPTPTP